MNGLNLFYDKKTTRMYCALSGLDQDNKKDSTTFNDIRPCIGELSTLDTMLTIQNYIFPENLPTKYSINADASQIVGFSSSGYMLCDYAEGSKIPKGITTFNLRGDTLCKFILADAKDINVSPDTITRFQTFYWNTDQDRINFLIPYRDTVYQLSSSHSITPLYTLHKDNQDKPIRSSFFLGESEWAIYGSLSKRFSRHL